MGPLYLFRVAALRAPLTDRFSAVAVGQTECPLRQKNMQAHFSSLGDDHDDSAASADALKEAAALYLDPRNRLLAHGPDALTDADTLSLLLGERDHLLATRLLLDFGSLTALSRASLVQLLPFLNREKPCASSALFASPLFVVIKLLRIRSILPIAFTTSSPAS